MRELELVRGLGLFSDARYVGADKHDGIGWDVPCKKMWDYLAIFHPELPLETRQKMVREAHAEALA